MLVLRGGGDLVSQERQVLTATRRLGCRRNPSGAVGFWEMGCDGVQLKTRAHLGNGITKNAPPKAFTMCRRGSLYGMIASASYVGQGTPDSGISSAARGLVCALPRRLHDLYWSFT